MFSNNGKISDHQTIRLLVMDMFTGACLFLPMALSRVSGYGGLAAYVLGILLTWGYGCLIAKNLERVSMRQWVFYGKDVGTLVCRFLYGLRCFASYVFLMGLFTTVLHETFLYTMTKGLIVGAMVIVLIYGCRKGIEVRARLAELFFYIALIPILLIGFFSLPEAQWSRIFVLEGATWQGILKGVLITWVVMAPIEWMMYLPLETKNCGSVWIMNKAVAFGGILAGVILVLCQTVLTVPGMTLDRWPTVILMQIMKIPGGFISRQDGFMLSFWIFAMFISLSGAVSHASELLNLCGGDSKQITDCEKNESVDEKNPNGLAEKSNKLWLSALIILGAAIALKAEMQHSFLNIYFYGMILTGIFSLILLLCRWFVQNKFGKYRGFLGAVLLLSIGLSGCENYVELEQRDFVMALGVDLGVTKRYQFTFTFPDLSALTGNGVEGMEAPITFEADTLKEAESYYNQISENKLDYGQLKVIIFGNAILPQKKYMEILVNEIKYMPEIARTVYVCQCRSLASELISIEEKIETSVGVYLEQIFKKQKSERIFNEWMLEQDMNDLPIVFETKERLGLSQP